MVSSSYCGCGLQKKSRLKLYPNLRNIISISLGISVVALGFLRDYLFYNINWIYLTLINGRRNAARREFYFLLEWKPQEIIQLKWFLTVLFYILFAGLTCYFIHHFFRKKEFLKISIGFYLGIFLLSGIIYSFGYFSGFDKELYPIIRTLMGIAQSFMPLMVLFVIFKFYSQSESN